MTTKLNFENLHPRLPLHMQMRYKFSGGHPSTNFTTQNDNPATSFTTQNNNPATNYTTTTTALTFWNSKYIYIYICPSLPGLSNPEKYKFSKGHPQVLKVRTGHYRTLPDTSRHYRKLLFQVLEIRRWVLTQKQWWGWGEISNDFEKYGKYNWSIYSTWTYWVGRSILEIRRSLSCSFTQIVFSISAAFSVSISLLHICSNSGRYSFSSHNVFMLSISSIKSLNLCFLPTYGSDFEHQWFSK